MTIEEVKQRAFEILRANDCEGAATVTDFGDRYRVTIRCEVDKVKPIKKPQVGCNQLEAVRETSPF